MTVDVGEINVDGVILLRTAESQWVSDTMGRETDVPFPLTLRMAGLGKTGEGSILHKIIVAVRMLEAALYHLGPGILAKYTMPCAWLICGLCVVAACFELAGRRPVTGLLWITMAVLLYVGFWFETTLYSRQWSEIFGLMAGAVAVWLGAVALWRGVRGIV